MIPSADLQRTPVNIISRSSQRQEAAPAPDRFSLIDRTRAHVPPAAPDPQHGAAPTGTGAGCPHRARSSQQTATVCILCAQSQCTLQNGNSRSSVEQGKPQAHNTRAWYSHRPCSVAARLHKQHGGHSRTRGWSVHLTAFRCRLRLSTHMSILPPTSASCINHTSLGECMMYTDIRCIIPWRKDVLHIGSRVILKSLSLDG